jgi:small subunit ribosomal protein S13
MAYKHIVRIVNTDLNGSVAIVHALTKIKGVSYMLANTACNVANIEKVRKTGELEDGDIRKLDDVIRNPARYGVPSWMFNRRNDWESGEDKHLLSSELDFVRANDIRRLQRIKSYRGLRHAWGQPVRGQRTRSNFRRNKGKVMGVKRKATGAA